MLRQSIRNLAAGVTSITRRYGSTIVERKAAVGNLKINYVQSGSGEKGVLLMPGALGSAWTDFAPQIQQLPELLPNYTIIAWDPPGYGKSIPPKRDFCLDFFQNDAQCSMNLMKELGFSKFSILGWSDGGITGLMLCGQQPHIVDKLVIWGANAYITGNEVKAMEARRDVSKWSERMREPMVKMYGEKRFPELWGEWINGVAAIYKQRGGDFCKREVENITSPVLIVHGKKDPMIAPEHVPFLRQKIPKAKYFEFPEGKHNIHLRYAEEFNKMCADFLLNVS